MASSPRANPPVEIKPLTPKQQLFIDEYMRNGRNASQGYMTVYGVDAKVAKSAASRLLANVNVVAEVNRRLAEYRNKAGIEICDVLLAMKPIWEGTAPDTSRQLQVDTGWKVINYLRELQTEVAAPQPGAMTFNADKLLLQMIAAREAPLPPK